MPRRRHSDDDDLDDVPPAKLTAQNLREAAQLYGYVWPYRRKFAAAFAALMISSALGLLFPAVLGVLIDVALGRATTWPAGVNRTALALVGLLAAQAVFSFAQS